MFFLKGDEIEMQIKPAIDVNIDGGGGEHGDVNKDREADGYVANNKTACGPQLGCSSPPP